MLDFVSIKKIQERSRTIISPEFKIKKSKDLMIRGHAFYAVWDEERKFWSTDEGDVQRIVDQILENYVNQNEFLGTTEIKFMKNFSTNKWTEWQKYCKSLPDNYHVLDNKILFQNDKIDKKDYATKCLPYDLKDGEINAYDRLMSVLYEPKEREKIEWGIGSIIEGDSKWIQKFMVLYGGPGTGKSTVLNLIQDMFEGYWSLFEAKALTSGSDFGLESLKNNSLIAIQHDGDLSRIDDNSLLNSVVSHEAMVVNEKHKSKYTMQFQSMLWVGTNKPVKITDSKSGVTRRLIDVHPTGEKLGRREYDEILKRIRFEYGGIAAHCLGVFRSLGAGYFDNYIAEDMITKTNDFYNFIVDNFDLFEGVGEDGITSAVMWRRYKEYCDEANVSYPLPMRIFKDEMKSYFERFESRVGNRYSVYYGFLEEKFGGMKNDGRNCNAVIYSINTGDFVRLDNWHGNERIKDERSSLADGDLLGGNDFRGTVVDLHGWLKLEEKVSLLDQLLKDCQAQYANDEETPYCSWDKCKTKLRDLDTRKLHYVRPPESMVVIDFDLKNEKGEKSYERNLSAAKGFPPTYAECSKSGSGIHLHYWYEGDISRLARTISGCPEIEIKTFSGKSSLRRMLSRCNNIEIATINSGLPLREEKKVITDETIRSERALRDLIKRNLKKEIHPATKPSMDFILKILEDAEKSGLHYDVRDMRPAIQNFAMKSSHNPEYCLKLINRMPFCSEEPSEDPGGYGDDSDLVFFDVEVVPNVFLICWKKAGPGQQIIRMFNPKPEEVENLKKFKLVGFNNRKYDNHMCYAAMMGYRTEQIFKLSQRIIIEQDKDAFFGEAYNFSYTDVYDFLSAPNKMSLKKWEIKLGIHHQEWNFPWDKPVPKELWPKLGEYCGYDVDATEAVFNANQADWLARKILAEWAEMTVNDTTNSLTTRLIVGKDPNPQKKFVYTDLSTIFPGYRFSPYGIPKEEYKEGAKIVTGKSIYRGEDPGEGGRVYAKPGMYTMVPVLDAESMHPTSIIELNAFGDEYTKRFKDIVDTRLNFKHKKYDEAKLLLPERLYKYFNNEETLSGLGGAVKTPINSTYGLTSARFPNKLKDPRNVDNIVAKRGALFMIDLQKEVESRGFTVAHVKTDSIKIPDATPEIIEFVYNYGKKFGYTFDKECVYSRMCLVNESTYVALVCEEKGKPVEPYWTATGAQFQVSYVFKTLFTKEAIEFDDLCETKSVSSALYLDFNEKLGEEHDYRFVGKVGLFCPVKDGVGGALLLREIPEDKRKNNRFAAATGTKKPDGTPYRWMEAEMVKELGLQDQIDYSYYDNLVDEAVEDISKYGDFEWFVSKDSPDWMRIPKTDKDEVPFETDMNKPEEEIPPEGLPFV